MSLLPGSQASEKDACVSFQLVKEREVKIFRAYKLAAAEVTAICLFAFGASHVVCFACVIMVCHHIQSSCIRV